MKLFKSLLFYIFLTSAAFAQIKLPQFDRFEVDKKHYFQTYTPKGLFAEQFPNFMTDGKYYYDSTFPDFLDNDPQISYKDYPADVASTTNLFKGIKKICIRYRSPGTWDQDILHAVLDKFKKQFEEHGVADVNVENVGDFLHENPITTSSDNDFTVDIYEVANTIDRFYIGLEKDLSKYDKKRFDNGELFPKFSLYKMTVRSRLGEEIKTYGQIILTDANTGIGLKKVHKIWVEFLNKGTAIAASSLVSRFLNDEVVVNKVYTDNKSISEKFAVDKNYINIANMALRLTKLEYSKKEILEFCEYLKVNFNDFSSYVDSHKNNQPAFLPSALNSAQTNQVASSVNALGTSIVSGIFDRQIENMHKENLATLKKDITKYNRDMQEVIDDIAALPPSTDKNELIARMQKSNPDLSGSLQEVLDSDKKSNESMAAAKTERNALLDNLNSTLQSLQNGNSQASSAAITSASAGKTVDECSTQATAAWKGSIEYRTYMRTKLNADMKDCQAKLIELTLQYCSSKLSPQEIVTDKKAASQARQDASDMRKATPNIKL